MQSTNRMQFVADGYVAAQKFCGIEWQVERAGAVLQSGRAGCAEFETQRPIPETALSVSYTHLTLPTTPYV